MSALLNVQGRAYPVEACLLDKDGTLLGFDHWLEVMRMRAERLGRALSLSRTQMNGLLRFVGLDEDGRPAGGQGITTVPRSEAEEAVAGYLCEVTGMRPGRARDAVADTFGEVDAQFPFEEHLRATPGAEGFLRAARKRGLKTALITHDAGAAAARHLQALGWGELVDLVVGIDRMPALKPSPDGLLAACRALGVRPERSMMAGDTSADVGAGRAAGCRPVIGLLTGLGDVRELSGADHVVDDLAALSFTTASTRHAPADRRDRPGQ